MEFPEENEESELDSSFSILLSYRDFFLYWRLDLLESNF